MALISINLWFCVSIHVWLLVENFLVLELLGLKTIPYTAAVWHRDIWRLQADGSCCHLSGSKWVKLLSKPWRLRAPRSRSWQMQRRWANQHWNRMSYNRIEWELLFAVELQSFCPWIQNDPWDHHVKSVRKYRRVTRCAPTIDSMNLHDKSKGESALMMILTRAGSNNQPNKNPIHFNWQSKTMPGTRLITHREYFKESKDGNGRWVLWSVTSLGYLFVLFGFCCFYWRTHRNN